MNNKLKELILSPMEGKTKLWIVYWIYGGVLSFVLPTLFTVAMFAASASGILSVDFAGDLITIFVAIYFSYVLAAVYQCRSNTTKYHLGMPAVVITAVGYALMLLGLYS